MVNGKEQPIRTDYRVVMDIFQAINDCELTNGEKAEVILKCLYEEFDDMNSDDLEEALKQAVWYLDGGDSPARDSEAKKHYKMFDWEQDEKIIFSAINKVAGFEVREKQHLHWWTFLGFFNEIEEGLFTTVLGIRQKRAKRKKLEKWEQEFYRQNKALCDLVQRKTAEEQAEIDYWNKLLG